MTDQIFHYTNIDSLALILQSRKIRFTRLDRVDDIREAQTHSGIEFGKYFFVSCWTVQGTESIPHWNMYSRDMQGVRLELPKYPFQQKKLESRPDWTGIEVSGELYAPLGMDEIFGPKHFIAPLFMDIENFAGPVEYDPDIESRYRASIQRTISADRKVEISIQALPKLARLKSSDWAFQQEYRFSLFALPSLQLPPDGPGSSAFTAAVGAHISQSFIDGIDPGITYIDVDLNPIALDRLIVRTGPLCSDGGILCTEALLAKFAPNARLEKSALAGTIRSRR